MDWPKVHDKSKWKVIKNNEEHWFQTKDKDWYRVGLRTVYQEISSAKKQKVAKVLEINLFGRGAVIQTLFTHTSAKSHITTVSRVLKNGRWLYGLPMKPARLIGLRKQERFIGIRIELVTAPGKIEQVDMYKS